MTHQKINIAIVGGGVGGLALALHLHARGVVCHVFASAGVPSQPVRRYKPVHHGSG